VAVLRAAVASVEPTLVSETRRLAAVAGAELEVVDPAAAPASWWRRGDALLLDPAVATCAAAAAPPRRRGVAVVAPVEADLATWRLAVELGADVVVVLPDEQRRFVDWLAGLAEADRPRAPVLAVLPGCGGAGASTLAALLACVAAARGPSVLVDLAPGAGGLDLVLGMEAAPGARWPDLAGSGGLVDPDGLAAVLPRHGELLVVSGARGHLDGPPVSAVSAVVGAAARWGRVVVADLPSAPGPASDTALEHAGSAVVVVPAQVRAVAAAAAVVRRVRERGLVPCLAVAGPAVRGGLRPAEVAAGLGCELVCAVQRDPRWASAVDRGEFLALADRRATRRRIAPNLDALLARAA
jgi:secretion/DNA translocation related CpaE-like protein